LAEDASRAPDLALVREDERPSSPAVLFSTADGAQHFSAEPAVPEAHALVADLDWSGLLAAPVERRAFKEGDEPLVWHGDRPIIALRRTPALQLLLDFDLTRSNASQLPA